MNLFIIIGYHEDTGEAIAGNVGTATNDRDAIALSLASLDEMPDEVGGWRCFEYLDSWGPGREVHPIDSDYR